MLKTEMQEPALGGGSPTLHYEPASLSANPSNCAALLLAYHALRTVSWGRRTAWRGFCGASIVSDNSPVLGEANLNRHTCIKMAVDIRGRFDGEGFRWPPS
jgi:hypothetical protein